MNRVIDSNGSEPRKGNIVRQLTLGDVCQKASSNIAQKDLQDKMGDISSLSNLMMKRYPLYDFKIRTCEVYL